MNRACSSRSSSSDLCGLSFDAIGGHTDTISYGDCTSDGRTTIRKDTTGWEVLWYAAMHTCEHQSEQVECRVVKDEGNVRKDVSAASSEDDYATSKLRADLFLRAVGYLAAFTPTFTALRFPAGFTPATEPLRSAISSLQECNSPVITGWLELSHVGVSAVVRALFSELFSELDGLHGLRDVFDAKNAWGVGLADETCGMRQPCVMDVKVGFIRYSPLTTKEKLFRIFAKEGTAPLSRQIGLRLVGMRRYVTSAETTIDISKARAEAAVKETTVKQVGYAQRTTEQLRACMGQFFSTRGFLSFCKRDRTESLTSTDKRNNSGQVLLRPLSVVNTAGTVVLDAVEGDRMRKRQAHLAIQDLYRFFTHSAEGQYLLRHMAFVSTSFLFVYDAAEDGMNGSKGMSVKLIDFARSGLRCVNYDEKEVGFVAGLGHCVEMLK